MDIVTTTGGFTGVVIDDIASTALVWGEDGADVGDFHGVTADACWAESAAVEPAFEDRVIDIFEPFLDLDWMNFN